MQESYGPENIESISLSDLIRVFLPLLESLRDLLARRLVRDCQAISDQDLNYTLLSSILQVLFLRTGQDYGFVEPGTLALLAGSDGISLRMARACSDAGLSPDILFEKGPDASRTIPAVPDDALCEVIRSMDSEKFPVSISTLPTEHLAVVFEHFLGTRMQMAEGYRVTRAGKSAQLYTGSVNVPAQAVVDYVVMEAIKAQIKEQESGCETRIRILDPACGSGIFLLAACRFLTHYQMQHTESREKREELLRDLLCQSVYGTDIDPESVSAARFILLLFFIGECGYSGSRKNLPDRIRQICVCLNRTVRCGNALIAMDYFSGRRSTCLMLRTARKSILFRGSWHFLMFSMAGASMLSSGLLLLTGLSP